jgi:hypothetical protein
MAFSIKNDHADAVIQSLDERLQRERRLRCAPGADRLTAAIAVFRSLPVLDHRTPDEILDYDVHGLPA